MPFSPSPNTILFITIFVLLYFAYLVRSTIRSTLDLYDFVLLSMVAAIPAAFVYFPGLASWTSKIFGVAFPLEVIFGALFVALFVQVHMLIVKSNIVSRKLALLVQENGLVRLELEELRRGPGKAQGVDQAKGEAE